MKSNKNNNSNNNGEEPPQQLRKSARKRKLNKLANDGKPAGGGEDQQKPEECISKTKCEGKNDQDLEQIVQLQQVAGDGDGEKEIAYENEEQAEEEAELQIRQPMKIQMSKETWFDMLEFVGRHQLGQIMPQVGDRQFAGIAQSFLHNYGRITLANICISDPRHRLIQHAVEMPENVKNFCYIGLSYLNTSVINLLQKFQQASLFGNVNLDLRLQNSICSWNTMLQTLAHILPSLDNINSIRGGKIELVRLCNANSEAAMAMLKIARFLDIYHDSFHYAPDEIAFLNRWLHTPRDDGKPRVLILPVDYTGTCGINNSALIIHDTIKSEFATAKLPVCLFIRFFVRDTVDWRDSSMENGETREKLVIKKVATTGSGPINRQTMALISRYPLGADKHWIEANEREALDWDFDEQNGRICLGNPIRNAIDNGDDNWPHDDPNADGEDGPDDQGGSRANSNYGDRDRAFGDRRGLRAMAIARRGVNLCCGGIAFIRGGGGRFQGRGGGDGGGSGGTGGQGRGGRGRGRGGSRGRGEGTGEEVRRGLRLRRGPIYFRPGQ